MNDSYGPSHYAESNTVKLHAARSVDAVTSQFATRFHAITRAIAESVAPRIGVSDKTVRRRTAKTMRALAAAAPGRFPDDQ